MKDSTLVVCGIAINKDLAKILYIESPYKDDYTSDPEKPRWCVDLVFAGSDTFGSFNFKTEEQAYLFYQTIIDEMM